MEYKLLVLKSVAIELQKWNMAPVYFQNDINSCLQQLCLTACIYIVSVFSKYVGSTILNICEVSWTWQKLFKKVLFI